MPLSLPNDGTSQQENPSSPEALTQHHHHHHSSSSSSSQPSSVNPQLDPESLFLLQSYTQLRHILSPSISSLNSSHSSSSSSSPPPPPVIPPKSTLQSLASASLPSSLPDPPLGAQATASHLLDAILPSLNNQAISPRYYGFVVGSVLPVAQAADNLVSALDQNVQVHLPLSHSASTSVEDSALRMVIDLLDLSAGEEDDDDGGSRSSSDWWKGRTFTTGATASNVLGLACGREHVIDRRLRLRSGLGPGPLDEEDLRGGGQGKKNSSVAELGLLRACLEAGVRDVQVLTSLGHSSLAKAASLVGIGHGNVKDIGKDDIQEGGIIIQEPWRLDLEKLETELEKGEKEGVVSIIAISAGEVNTGRFATGVLDMPKIRSLADRYGAWVHVDGAFGICARALPKTDEFLSLHAGVAGLELADSIGADGHKMLNVPYDNGIFLCRNASVLTQVFSNPNAAYLSSGNDPNAILSPLNIGIENSRRFRALPVYAALLSEGRQGMAAMFSRMVHLARRIAAYIRDSPHYEWLPDQDAPLESTFIVVLFRAKDQKLNEVLVDRINANGNMYVSGTSWGGKKAVRLAVSTWRVDVERDAAIVEKTLNAIAVEDS